MLMNPAVMLRWFGPPQLSRPDLRRHAQTLWIVSWPFVAVVTMLLGIAVLVEPDTLARRATTVAATAALVAVLHTISRTGRPLLASWILVIGLPLIVTQRAWITGGIHAPVSVFYALFIVMASVLIGLRGGLAAAAVCVLGASVLAAGTALDWLTRRPGAGSALGGFIFVIMSIALALLVVALMTLRPRREALDEAAAQLLVQDMRSPLHVLLAHLELLRSGIRDQRVAHVEAAIDGAMALHRLTGSLLDISRLESGLMPIRRSVADLAALGASVVAAVRVLRPGRAIVIDTNGDAPCTCDPELTRRILETLVSNALKQTPIWGRVRVVISSAPDRASIAVHDEGPGLPLDDRSSIFAPFGAAEPGSASGREPSGLGLAFCRLAVQAQGGAIRIEDNNPRGSVFVVELPR